MLPFVEGLRCRECARSYPAQALHVCEWCFGPLEVVYDYDAIRRSMSRESIAAGPLSIWRYADLLPVAACASTGNLANAVAAHAAQAGMESVVFIPSDLEAGKVVTTAVFGGRLIA